MGFKPRAPKPLTGAKRYTTEGTWWDGVKCVCRRVMVRVGTPPNPPTLPWYAGMEGTLRRVVEVTTVHPELQRFYLDDEAGPLVQYADGTSEPLWNEGEGWSCVTRARGNARHGYKSVWADDEPRELRPEEYPKPYVPMSTEQQYNMRRAIREQIESHNQHVRERAQQLEQQMGSHCQ